MGWRYNLINQEQRLIRNVSAQPEQFYTAARVYLRSGIQIHQHNPALTFGHDLQCVDLLQLRQRNHNLPSIRGHIIQLARIGLEIKCLQRRY